MNKRELEKLVSNDNEVVWRDLPHILSTDGSVLQVANGFLEAHKLDTFLKEIKETKNSFVFIHSKSNDDEIIWDGMIRYRIVTKSKTI